MVRGTKKIGRNELCPCDSGKKYKKCHGRFSNSAIPTVPIESFPGLKNMMNDSKAKHIQREHQQGKGKPIISQTFKGQRLIAVGNTLHYSDKWKTMHDFLLDYIKICFGKEWWLKEVARHENERHTLIQWSFLVYEYTKNNQNHSRIDGSHEALMTGAVSAYLNLGYFLYLIQHNIELHEDLINRLKRDGDDFRGAYYEAYVASKFVLAGFDIELEDERDSSTTHHEFTVKHKDTGKKFHVEAKSRKENKEHSNIGNQLYKALIKKAIHERIVFIDINLPSNSEGEIVDWVNKVSTSLIDKEAKLKIKGEPAPKAYVFVTNNTELYNLDETKISFAVVPFGFKINDFGYGSEFNRILDAVKAKRKHREMFDLMSAIEKYQSIPVTFDGENPHLDNLHSHPEIQLGKQQLIIIEGRDILATLSSVVVIENESRAYLAYNFENKSVMMTYNMSEKELKAYKAHPNTFFGKYEKASNKLRTPLDAFEFFHGSYNKLSKESLLDKLKTHPDLETLKKTSRNKLCDLYCEQLAIQASKGMELTGK